jgi:hypothetical protein
MRVKKKFVLNLKSFLRMKMDAVMDDILKWWNKSKVKKQLITGAT